MRIDNENSLSKWIAKQQISNSIERSQLNIKKTEIIYIFRRNKHQINLTVFRIWGILNGRQ